MAGGLKERERQGFYDPADQDGLNPAKQAYDDNVDASLRNKEAGDDLSDREAATSNAIGNKLADNSSSLNEKENNSAGLYEQSSSKPKSLRSRFTKKRIIGIVGGALGLGGVAASIFLPGGTMIFNLYENLISGNDASSVAMERRFFRSLKHINNDSNNSLCRESKRISCRMGTMSNNSLRRLAKRGIKPVFDGGAVDYKDLKRTGYPDRNPTAYEIEDGGKTHRVKASELSDFLRQKENRKIAAKVLGVGGVFNMRYRAWFGKNIKSRFYNKFKLSRAGDFVKSLGDDAKEKGKQKLDKVFDKLKDQTKQRMPGVSEATARLKTTVGKRLNSMKKAGSGYFLAASGCMAAKAPKLIGGAVAAVQLLQITEPVMKILLSTGGKAKASGFNSGFSAEEMDIIGSMMTEKTTNKQGKKTSALDSKYLLSAIGVNKNKPAVSEKFTPGYGVLNGPLRSLVTAGDALEGPCDAILSPTAMYSAMAADVALKAVSTGIPIVGILKAIAEYAAVEVLSYMTEGLVAWGAEAVLKAVAENDDIPSARGEELGDVLGIGAIALFSSGAMSRGIPPLTVKQAQAFNAIKQETVAFHREMDIASHSPFDISNRHTFLGSLLYNTQVSFMSAGVFSSPLRAFSMLPKMALTNPLFQSRVNAATNYSDDDFCSYAGDFGIDREGGDPAINVAGLPCVGLSDFQDKMDTATAIELMKKEDWIDETVDVEETDGIDELINKGVIKKDTPLTDFLESCADASTGEYLFNTAGCVIDDESSDGSGTLAVTNAMPHDSKTKTVNGEQITKHFTGKLDDTDVAATQLKDSRSMAAIPVFLLDYQVIQSMNGGDEEEAGDTPAGSSAVGAAELSEAQRSWGGHRNGQIPASALREPVTTSGQGHLLHPKAAAAFDEMNRAYKADMEKSPQNAKEAKKGLQINEAYRTLETQQEYYNSGATLASPGTSNHGNGLAIDIEVGSEGFQSPIYKWLAANAGRYGFVNPAWARDRNHQDWYKDEPWHWEYARRVE